MKVPKLFVGAFVLALVGVIAIAFLTEKVPPATIGVKQNLWGGSGVIPKDYGTGIHIGIAGYHKWHMLDRRTHFLTFAEDGVNSSLGRTMGPLEVRTKDNNLATYDVTVTYRIVPDEAHLIVQDGLQHIYRDRVVATVESVLREEFAELSSEDLFSTKQRLEVANRALPILKGEMSGYHVVPGDILIRAINFQPTYENKLQQKQLLRQELLLDEAMRFVEDQGAITETLAADIVASEKELRGDWDKRLQTARSQNEVQIAVILAEANVYEKSIRARADAAYETSVAEGSLAIAKAEALRNELRNRALDTTGGRIFLAKEAADNLQFESVTLNSNSPNVPSILDIGELVKLLIGEP